MALSDHLEEPPRRKTGRPCSVQVLLDKLEGLEHDALNAMLYELGWSASKIYKKVTDEGHVIGYQTINRHRSQSCRCYQ